MLARITRRNPLLVALRIPTPPPIALHLDTPLLNRLAIQIIIPTSIFARAP